MKTRTATIAKALRVPGWMAEDELRWLATAALRARVVVEVGSWKGRSTRALADNCSGVVYTIDRWGGACQHEDGSDHPVPLAVYPEFQRWMRDHLRTGRVVALRGSSSEQLASLASSIGRVVDLGFIDGDHRYREMQSDIGAMLALVRPGGTISGHDYTNPAWPGVARAVDETFGALVRHTNAIWWVTVP